MHHPLDGWPQVIHFHYLCFLHLHCLPITCLLLLIFISLLSRKYLHLPQALSHVLPAFITDDDVLCKHYMPDLCLTSCVNLSITTGSKTWLTADHKHIPSHLEGVIDASLLPHTSLLSNLIKVLHQAHLTSSCRNPAPVLAPFRMYSLDPQKHRATPSQNYSGIKLTGGWSKQRSWSNHLFWPMFLFSLGLKHFTDGWCEQRVKLYRLTCCSASSSLTTTPPK